MTKTPYKLRGGRYYADLAGRQIPQYIHTPHIRAHPDVVKNKRVRFALGLMEGARACDLHSAMITALEIRYNPEEHTTVQEAFDYILEEIDASDLKQYSKNAARRVASQFLAHCKAEGVRLASELNPSLVVRWKKKMVDKGRKSSGIASYLSQLGNLLKSLKINGFLPQGFDRDTWFHHAKVKRHERSWRVFTQDELDVAMADPNVGDIITGLLYSGSRVGVFLQLRPQDIDWEKRLITYPVGKQGKVHRQQLTDDLYEFFKGRKPVSSKGFYFWKDEWKFDNPFNDKHLIRAESWLNVYVKKLLVKALHKDRICRYKGVEDPDDRREPIRHLIWKLDLPKTHDIRATTATRLLSLGMDPVSISRFIGWENAATFLTHYCRLNPSELNVPSLSKHRSNVRTLAR